jgi:hypothetical protein
MEIIIWQDKSIMGTSKKRSIFSHFFLNSFF